MRSNLYKELREGYSIRREVFGAVLLAVLMIGGVWATVRGNELKREWANLEARACLIP